MISIFSKRAFLNINPSQDYDPSRKPHKGGHLMRVSSMIRADQITDRIGDSRLNPESGYENDVCIYVKPRVQKGDDFEFKGRVNYLDIIDGHNLGQLLINHPDVICIVCSKADEETMKSVIKNKIIYIPQHHCNFERLQRKSDAVRRIGVIGELPAFEFLPKGLDEALKERNIELVKFSRFFSRQDVVDFYMSIDMQIVWRPWKKILSNPLKIVNAASFGIPTIALNEKAFEEIHGAYFPVKDFDHLLQKLDDYIAHPELHSDIADHHREKAEFYHIDNVTDMYRGLNK